MRNSFQGNMTSVAGTDRFWTYPIGFLIYGLHSFFKSGEKKNYLTSKKHIFSTSHKTAWKNADWECSSSTLLFRKLLKPVLFIHLLTKMNAHDRFYPSLPGVARVMLNQCKSDQGWDQDQSSDQPMMGCSVLNIKMKLF